MKEEDLRRQFYFLSDIGLGHIARDVISNRRQLRRLLRSRERKLPPEKIAARLFALAVVCLCIMHPRSVR
jgi:hypothetical protein